MGRFLALLVFAVAAAVAVAPAQAATLLGDTQVEKSAVRYADGTAIAFPTTATLSRSLGRISIYVDRGSAAGQIVVGLYADAAGAPGMLLARGTIDSPVGDAWNIARVTPTDVGAGQSYWIAALSPLGDGSLRIRQQADRNATPVATSKSRTLSDLPLSWGAGKASRGGPVSVYGSEGPVLSVAPNSLAFDAQERGAASPAQLVQISNSGDGLLGWSVTSDAPWLSVLPIFGLGSGTVSVAVVPGTLAAGTYRGTVTVIAPGAQRSPQAIDVTLRVGDAKPPTVSLTAPADGSLLHGSVDVSADAADESGIAGVQFLVDNTPIGAEDGSAPFAVAWDSASAADGSHVLRAVARDRNGNQAEARIAVGVDNTAPAATVDAAPADPSNDASPSFRFSADDAAATLACSLDGADFAACTSPQSYASLADGAHEFRVRATDRAGNTGTAARVAWTVDTTAPTVSLDATPKALTNVSAPAFSFSSEAGATLGCALDGAVYSACTSPQSYPALADGSHRFSVRATDAAGNSGTADFTWSIDTVAPAVTIDAKPADPSNDPAPSLSFSAEPGATLECALDDAPYGACSSPQAYASLAEGAHGFSVRATDAAGNSADAGYRWTVDTTPPTATIDSQPAAWSRDASPSFSFSSEPDATFECSLDGADFAACSSPAGYTGLADGAHTFAVRATDRAGNTGRAATTGWTVDTTAPTVTLTGKPADPSTDASPSFAFAADEADVTFACSLDGGAAVDCTSPRAYTGLADGAHTFVVVATDRAGNESAAVSYGWTLDSSAPTVTISGKPADPSGSGSASFSFSSEPGATFRCALDGGALADCASPKTYAGLADGAHTFRVDASDAAGNTGSASYGWTVDTSAPTVAITAKPADPSADAAPAFSFAADAGSSFECALDGAAFAACASPKSYAGIGDGRHTFVVRPRDRAGNVGADASYSWTVDTTAPTGSFSTPAGGATVADTILVAADVADSGTGVAGVQFTVDGANVGPEDTTAPYSAAWDTTTIADGPHVLGAVVRDAVGNRGAIPALGVTVKNAADPGTQIDVGPGYVDASTRQVVRTASDRVYIFAADDSPSIQKVGPGIIRAYRADQTGIPRTFSEADAGNRPRSGASTNQKLAGVDARLDANGVVHLVYVDNGDFTLVYTTFDTRTDRWGTAQVLATGVGAQARGRISYGLALDDNDNSHVVYGKGTSGLFYVNNVAGTWSAATLLSNDPATLHPSLAFDGTGNLHVAWLEGGTTPRIVYKERLATGTWQGSDTVAGTDVLTNANADQGPSIVVTRSGTPYVLYVSALPKSAIRIKFRAGTSWVLDSTPTDVFAHTPAIYSRGDDVYAFLGHDSGINFGYEAHLAGQPWSPYQKLNAEQHDGSANIRWEPRRDPNPGVIDASYYDEDRLHDRSFLPELYYLAVLPTKNTAPTDTTAPTVSITAPAGGATLSGSVNVTAAAADDVSVAGVQFLLDGAPLGAEDTSAPYGVAWDTTVASRGSHLLGAIVRDNAGHATTAANVNVSVQNAAASGLVGAWGFETACGVSEGGGGAFCDASGLGNLAWTKGGTAKSPVGKFGQAASFDGATGYLEVPDADSLDLATGMTLEAWVDPSALQNWMAVLFKEKPGAPANLVYALYANSDLATGNRPSAHVFTSADQNFRAGTTLPLGVWTHLALTYDGATEKLYENGTLVGSKAVTGAMPATAGALHIGGDLAFGNEWFNGLIDEVRVYNRALSGAEITADMGTPVGS